MPVYQLRLVDRNIVDLIDQIAARCCDLVASRDGRFDRFLRLRGICKRFLRRHVRATDV